MNAILRTLWSVSLLAVILTVLSCQKQAPTETNVAPVPSADVPLNSKPKVPNRFMYTYVAKCQMRCAKVGTKSIREAVEQGKIKSKSAWLKKKPCPFYAVTHKTAKGQDLVVIFAVCSSGGAKDATKIVRVFDKNMKNCDCTAKKVMPPAKS